MNVPGTVPCRISGNKWHWAGLIALVVAAFYPVFTHDFLYRWDDQWMVMNGYTEGGWSPANLWRISTDFYNGQYAPLNQFFYLAVYSVWGYNPLAFHLFSLVFHLFNLLLGYWFIRELLKKAAPGCQAGLIAFLTVLLWGVHPVTVESVAWISASKILVYTCFYLLAAVLYLKYTATKQAVYFGASLFFFCLSFFAKEQAVTFPLLLVLLDWAIARDLKNREIWLEKLPFFACALLFGVITVLSEQGRDELLIYPFIQRLVFGCYSLVEYTVKCMFPVKLLYIYPFPIQLGEALPLRYYFYPFLLAVSVYACYLLRKERVLVFCLLFFVIHLSTVLHLVPISRFAIVADRYVYLSCMGLVMLFVFYGVKVGRTGKIIRTVVLTGCGVYLLYFVAYTNFYARRWKDSFTLKKEMRELLEQRKEAILYEDSSPNKINK